MTGIYCNNNSYSKPFIFRRSMVLGNGYSARMYVFRYTKVGKFDPSKFEGNLLISPECMARWT